MVALFTDGMGYMHTFIFKIFGVILCIPFVTEPTASCEYPKHKPIFLKMICTCTASTSLFHEEKKPF